MSDYASRLEHLASSGHSTDYAGSGMGMRHFREPNERDEGERFAKNEHGVKMRVADDYIDEEEPFVRVLCEKCERETNIEETDERGFCPDCAEANPIGIIATLAYFMRKYGPKR